jgi:cysteinyl-tRNA synthetase
MKIYNSLKRQKEEFRPIKEAQVGMYVCGPTVYDEPHIGHARSAYIFDIIRRYFEYKGYKMTFVRNVTDVDDKIINKAKELLRVSRIGDSVSGNGTELIETAKAVSVKYLDAYHEDMETLGIRKPDREPKATEYIPKMIDFINVLIAKGAAYAAGGDVYFNIKAAKDYGKLSNQNLEKMEIGSRISPGEAKKDPLDFALWKSAKEGEPSWPSPWGAGRPGWHIECSVMSSDILGDEFDIHGGGIDLIFPHHENEVAQSEGAGKKFARYWIHNGLLTIDKEKMAKSLGNFITIKGFLEKKKDPDYLKLFFLAAHYASPIDYTDEKIEEAKKEKERFKILLNKIADRGSGIADREKNKDLEQFRTKFESAMDDDFNTPLALATLFDLVTYTNKLMHEKDKFSDTEIATLAAAKELILELSSVFGLNLAKEYSSSGVDATLVEKLIGERNDARKAKDFKKADEVRNKLTSMNIILEDTKDGTTWRVKA